MPIKSIFASKTFWGSVIMLVSQFFPKLFTILGITPDTAVDQVVAFVGFVVTVYGRLQAHQAQVTLTGK